MKANCHVAHALPDIKTHSRRQTYNKTSRLYLLFTAKNARHNFRFDYFYLAKSQHLFYPLIPHYIDIFIVKFSVNCNLLMIPHSN